jgi:L-ribulose-5-phosphate 4-epimerase
VTRGHADVREAAYRANLALVEAGLVTGTFGNVSQADRDAGVFAIKPSGVPYDRLTPDEMVVVALETGQVVEGTLRPSSDTPTHLELYRAFGCGGVAHTHSAYATAFAQGRRAIPCMGTTQADYFRGDVPITRPLTEAEVERDYERNTGLVIVEAFGTLGLSAVEIPGALVANHGPFTWGADGMAAVEHARLLEHLARVEHARLAVAPDAPRPDQFLIDRHYLRKHGTGSYYGQRPKGRD